MTVRKHKFKTENTNFIGASQDIDAHIQTIEDRHRLPYEEIGASQDLDAHIQTIEDLHRRPYEIDRVLVLEQGIVDLHDNSDNT